jgi:hypothetical protein
MFPAIALVLSLDIALATGLIPGWGHWYSDDLNYRLQTDALLQGSVALDTDAANISWDWAWWDGRAQQVWGLGIPLWRLPFEMIARAVGMPAFPDRFAFVMALAGITYLLLKTFLSDVVLKAPLQFARRRPASIVAPLLLVLHAPFLTLCRTRFWVYEEAQAYAYLFAILLAALTIRLVRVPSRNRYLSLAAVASVAGFIRPTLAFYAIASLVVATLAAVPNRRRLAICTFSIAICGCGWMLLAISNLDRFGAPTEFGHKLNLNGISRMRFASRFGDPYADEPLRSAATELFGALFLADDNFNGDDWYVDNIFPGQSATLRWRELYFSTYGPGTLLVIVFSWIWGLVRFAAGGPRTFSSHRFSAPFVLSIWSAIAAVLLAVFYLRFPFLASRYLLDFGPAFAACTAAIPFALSDLTTRRWRGAPWFSALVIGAVTVLWSYAALSAEVLEKETGRFPIATALTRGALQLKSAYYYPPPTLGAIPAKYYVGMGSPGISKFNGAGWSAISGRTRSAAVFFLPRSSAVEIELAGNPADLQYAASVIRARIGLQELELESVRPTESGRCLVFRRPSGSWESPGIQVLFVGMARPEELDRNFAIYRILQVRPTHLE